MNLNNKGWGLQTMMIFVLILMICLVIIAALVNNTFKDITGTSYNYSILEDKLESASKKYVEKNNISVNEGSNYTITVSKLQKSGYLTELKDNEIKCTGYTIVEKEKDKLVYKPYIRCGSNYKTKNYTSVLDI
ncbi:MAG: hypothetical protein E7170_00985 [Firmicutes bacterium]|nr:hypothetical protein [Bacillota bacterium]